jgi:hypothetical protein
MQKTLLRWVAVPGVLTVALSAGAQAPEKKPGGSPPAVQEEIQRIQDQLRRMKEEQARLMKELGNLQGQWKPESQPGAKPGKGMPGMAPDGGPGPGPGMGWQNQPRPQDPPPWARDGQQPGMAPGMGWQGHQQNPGGPPPWARGGQDRGMTPGMGPGMGRWNRQPGPGAPDPGGGGCESCPNRADCPHRGPGGMCPQGRGVCPQGGPFPGPQGRGGFQPSMDRNPAMRERMEMMRERFLERNPGMRERVERFQRETRGRAEQFRNEMRDRGLRFREEMHGRPGEGRRPGGPPSDIDRRLNELEGMLRELRDRMPPPPPHSEVRPGERRPGSEREQNLGREREPDRQPDRKDKKGKKEKKGGGEENEDNGR